MHWKVAKRILCYNRGTMTDGLFYSHHSNFELVGYSDSDWTGDMDDRKSTSRFIFSMGDLVFSWMSKKQLIVIIFTCEAEYVAASTCVLDAI